MACADADHTKFEGEFSYFFISLDSVQIEVACQRLLKDYFTIEFEIFQHLINIDDVWLWKKSDLMKGIGQHSAAGHSRWLLLDINETIIINWHIKIQKMKVGMACTSQLHNNNTRWSLIASFFYCPSRIIQNCSSRRWRSLSSVGDVAP